MDWLVCCCLVVVVFLRLSWSPLVLTSFQNFGERWFEIYLWLLCTNLILRLRMRMRRNFFFALALSNLWPLLLISFFATIYWLHDVPFEASVFICFSLSKA